MGLKKKRYMSWILILLSHFNDTHHDQSLFFFFWTSDVLDSRR